MMKSEILNVEPFFLSQFLPHMMDVDSILLWLPGFNTTLRQGNVTHHEYIQVRSF